MANKLFPYSFMCAAAFVVSQVAVAQDVELKTLFTTAQERQVINSNRYHDDQPASAPIVTEPTQEAEKIQDLVKEQVVKTFQVAGISIDREGGRFAWLNGTMYSNNSELEDGLILKIRDGNVKSVLIKTADGSSFSGLTGETIEVIYRKVVNQ